MRTLLCHALQKNKKEDVMQCFIQFEIKGQMTELQKILTFSGSIKNEGFNTLYCWLQFHGEASDGRLVAPVTVQEKKHGKNVFLARYF